ncbi:Neprilysin 2 [Carabus blaptoides fortunei]
MNTSAIEHNSLHVLKKYLHKFGGWPVLEGEKWNERDNHWQQITYKLHDSGFGSNYLLRLYVFLNPKNSSQTVLFINQPLLGLKKEYLSKGLSNTIVKAYYKYMVNLAVILGGKRDYASKQLKQSLLFEMRLAKICLPKEQLRNFTELYNPITIRELQIRYPDISWLSYISKLLNGVTVTEDEVIILQSLNYLNGLFKLLNDTPKRIQANYLLWRVVENSVSFLSHVARKYLLQYTRIVSGTTALSSRWRECVSVVNNGMPVAVGSLYVRRYFSSHAKNEAEDMVQNIRRELRHILKKIPWMDRHTLKRAVDKLDAMEAHVGYPKELLNDTLVEQYYEKLNIHENRYLESVLEITKFERRFEFHSLHETVNKSNWIDHANAAVVNAFYTFSENSINLPAGILQGAFFESDRPKYMNYGAIGTVIGHEIIHGYDDKGRQYDKNGNLLDWWEEKTNEDFIKRAQCFVDQYENFTDKQVKMHLNGINTEGENIADNGGAKAAYMAYINWARRTHAREPKLPNLDYTPNQLFWLSMANAFCTKSRPEYTRLIITTDEHSPAMFRVLGTLSNLDEFSNDFNCDTSSAMNPERKCTLW